MPNAKGTVVVEAVKALLTHGDRARVYLPPKLFPYLEQRIVLASWYPLEDYAELLRTLAKVGAGRENPCERMGRDAARAHMDGTYSRFRKSADRRAAFTLLGSMYDSGEMRVVEREAGRAVMDLVAFALPTREICDTFTGYQSGWRCSASRTSGSSTRSAASSARSPASGRSPGRPARRSESARAPTPLNRPRRCTLAALRRADE